MAQETEAELPDWMTELPSVAATDMAQEAEAELPDWMTELPSVEAKPLAIDTDYETPDWLAELPSVEATDMAQEADSETPDWMTELPSVAATDMAQETESELPDWLAELPSVAETDMAQETEAELPDWMTELPSVEAKPLDTDSETPDWLADLPSVAATDMAQEAETELPDWMTELPSVEAKPLAIDTDSETPDWLAELPSVEEMDMAQEAEAELPDWMTELPHGKAKFLPEPALPAWLTELPETIETTDSVEYEAETTPSQWEFSSDETETSADSADVPDWLSKIEVADDTLPTEPDAPSWLSDLRASLPDTDELRQQELAETGETDEDNANGLMDTPELDEPFFESPAETTEFPWLTESEDKAPDWLTAPLPSDGATPDWLVETSAETASPSWLTENEAAPPALDWMTDLPTADGDNEAPTWLADLAMPPETEAPDWLTELPRETPPTAVSNLPEAATPENITASNWFKELQSTSAESADEAHQPKPIISTEPLQTVTQPPITSTPTQDMSGVVETTAVSAAIFATGLGAQTATTPAIVTTDRQTLAQSVQLFYEIATQPPQPVLIPETLSLQAKFMGRTVRAILYFIFIGLMALPLLPPLQKSVKGEPIPWTEPGGRLGELLAKQRHALISEELGIIDTQPTASVALVSFDYTPSSQGEMQPLAEAVVARLRGQGMRVIAVSFDPEGAMLAQQTLETILQQRKEKYGPEMVNLGFIPGQVTGLRSLIAGSNSLAQLSDFKPGGNWPTADWAEVKGLAQVNLIVTVSDNPTMARWWVEQLAVDSATKPALLAATSATVNPFMQPYRKNDQLDGLISGISGASAMEATRNNFGLARQMLDSQSLAYLIIIILIVAGTVVGWMPPMNEETAAPDSDETEEEDEDE